MLLLPLPLLPLPCCGRCSTDAAAQLLPLPCCGRCSTDAAAQLLPLPCRCCCCCCRVAAGSHDAVDSVPGRAAYAEINRAPATVRRCPVALSRTDSVTDQLPPSHWLQVVIPGAPAAAAQDPAADR